MKIVYLAAGAAGMYCGSCLHDNTLAAALLARGHDVLLMPTYTPIRTDEADVSRPRVFFGGINVYLQQKLSLFRHTPWFMDRVLDAPGLLNLVSKMNSSVDAARLGDLTVSMLAGEKGHQKKELEKLVAWIGHERPDVVHLSNAMLLGMAGEIRRLGIPVVCSLSGEDIFLEKLVEPFHSQARSELRARAGDADAYIALNDYYARYMADYLGVPRASIDVVQHGLKLDGHSARVQRPDGVFTIGFFARICHDKGLHQLVEAFELLAADESLPPLRLRAAGYLHQGDKPYLEGIRQRVARWRDPSRFEYAGELDRHAKIAFLHSLDVMSVPTVYRESKGISILEALANAVPVVQPAHGAFPEIVADTGGGLLTEPLNPQALAQALRQLILDPAQAAELGRRGHQAIHSRYRADTMGDATLDVYRRVTGLA